MVETGYGKILIIIKLNQILNNGKILIKIISIHPLITDKDIYEKIKKINEEVKNKEKIGSF